MAVSPVKASHTQWRAARESAVNRRDRELLDRQLRAVCIQPRRRNDSTMLAIATLAVVAVFAADLFVGNLHAGVPADAGSWQAAIAAASEAAPQVSR
jgi:hypothetical protein